MSNSNSNYYYDDDDGYNDFQCEACDVICNNDVEWKRHIKSTKHTTNSKREYNVKCVIPKLLEQEYSCILCLKAFDKVTKLEKHLLTITHKKKEAKHQEKVNPSSYTIAGVQY